MDEGRVLKTLFERAREGLATVAQPPLPKALAESLESWYQSPAGEQLLAMEREQLRDSLRLHPGFRAMSLQVCGAMDLLEDAPQLHRFALSNLASAPCAALTDFDALPLPSNTIDVVLMHHVLDYCELPHEALNEAARVVTPSGHLVVFGFNPYSWMGLFKWPMRVASGNQLWRFRLLSLWRVKDWLRLLGFVTEEVHYGCFAAPLPSRPVLQFLQRGERLLRKSGLPFGSYYMIVARKQVARPVSSGKPAWLPRGIAPVKLGDSSRVGCKCPQTLCDLPDSGKTAGMDQEQLSTV